MRDQPPGGRDRGEEAAAAAPPRRILLTTGMHRSGTSLLSHLLWRCGAWLGGPLDTAPLASNETGHWEHRDVVALQEGLLDDLGRTWHRDGDLPLPGSWRAWPESRAAGERLLALAASALRERDHWATKDPRAAQLLPLWQEVAARLGAELRVVLALRDPRAVAASLARRNAMAPALAGGIWRETHRALLAAAPARLHVVDYDRLLARPGEVLPELLAFCGLAPPPERIAEAVAAIRPERRHHRPEAEVLPALPRELGQLYRALREAPPGSPPPVPAAPSGSAPQAGEVLVVMRTAWRERLLPRALRSLLAQSHQAWHLRLVNDGGQPERLEAALAPYRPLFGPRLSVTHCLPAIGMEAASNLAIAEGGGDYVAIHDDDDSWRPRFLERMLAGLRASPAPALVCRAVVVRERMTDTGPRPLGHEPFGPFEETVTAAMLAVENRFPPIALLCRRAAVERLGGYRADLPVLGDWEFNQRLAALGPIPVLPEALAHWHLRPPEDPLPNSLGDRHRRYFAALGRHRARGDPAAPVVLDAEVARIPPGALAAAWAPAATRVLAPRPERGLAAGAAAGDWIAVSPDPQFGLLDPAAPLAAGLYLLRFTLETPEGQGLPQLFHGADGQLSEIDSLRLPPADGGRHALLLNLHRPHAALRLDPMDGTGPLRLGAVELVALGPPLPGLSRLGRQARLPDFLCIGAQRGGTTWLHQALGALPGLWLPPVKELHYFDHAQAPERWDAFRAAQALEILGSADADADAERRAWALDHAFGGPPTDAWYSRRFDPAPPDALLGEITPAYATLDQAGIARVLALLPRVKVLLLLRDPVRRALSGAAHALRMAGRPVTAEALAGEAESEGILARSDYRGTLERWSAALPPERIGIFFHDDLLVDPRGTLARIAAFLGLAVPDGVVLPAGRVNGGAEALVDLELAPLLARLSADLLPQLGWLAERLGGPARDWLASAERRLAADRALAEARPAADRREANLLQWDRRYAWPQHGDEWRGQAQAEGHDYEAWKRSLIEQVMAPWLPAGGCLLEIGPGHGRWTRALAERAGRLVLVDVSPNCLDHCRDRFAGQVPLRCHLGEGVDLPADLTGAVDGIWSFDALVHVAPRDLRLYLGEVARVLRPGGVALLHHAGRRHWALPLAGLVWRGLLPARVYRWISMGLAESADGWRSDVSATLVRRWAGEAGLEVVDQLRRWGPAGRFGLPRHRDRLTILRRPQPASDSASAAASSANPASAGTARGGG